MKKFILIAAVTVLFAACGGASTEKAATTDSTTIKVDSVKVDTAKAVDTTKK